MIIEHIVKGSKQTSWHDFSVDINGMNLIISNGSYYQVGEEKFKSDTESIATIPTLNELIHYEVWITQQGITVLVYGDDDIYPYDELINSIDKLAWFDVPANENNLQNVDVHVIKVV